MNKNRTSMAKKITNIMKEESENEKSENEKIEYIDYILPSINPNIYIEFLDSFIFGNNRKPPIVSPIPPCAG